MNLLCKEISGFKFVKVGYFHMNAIPYRVTYKGKEIECKLSLKLYNDLFKKADESTYLIFINDDPDPVYVGEYTYNLEDRWLRNSVYVWHSKDENIESELAQNNEVSLWLVVDPYLPLSNNKKINISKSIEQEILRVRYPDWNKRGQMIKYDAWRKDNCLSVLEIISRIKTT